MGDREPFEERKGRCLGHAVWGGEDVVEQAGRGNGAEDVSLASLKHCRQRMPRDEDVAHEIHVPDSLPLIGWSLRAAADRDPRVGAEDVDATVLRLHPIDEPFDLRLARNIAMNRGAADLFGDLGRPIEVEVGHHHRLGALAGKPGCQGTTDAPSPTGDHDYSACSVHGPPLSQTEKISTKKFLVENT